MWIIDRYLLRQFLQVFVIVWITFTGLFVVFHAFSNLDEFIRYCERHEKGLLDEMARFYSYRILAFFDQISPVLAMVAAMFTMTWIQRHNELTALMAAGISRRRVAKPVILAAICVSLLALANRESVIPGYRAELSRDPRDLGGENPQPLRSQYDNQTGVLFRGQQTVASEQRIHKPSFLLPTTIDPEGRTLVATDCVFQVADDHHPAGYWFKNVTSPLEMLSAPSLRQGDRTIVFTPHDHPDWLNVNECFVASGVSFEQVAGNIGWKQFASTRELIEGIKNPSVHFAANVRVAIHSRMVQPILDVTLLFLGMPLVLLRETRNMFMAIGLCVLLVAGFMGITLLSQYLGSSGLIAPALGAWLPLMVFVPLAVLMYDRVER